LSFSGKMVIEITGEEKDPCDDEYNEEGNLGL
jgi:hypothetical protein